MRSTTPPTATHRAGSARRRFLLQRPIGRDTEVRHRTRQSKSIFLPAPIETTARPLVGFRDEMKSKFVVLKCLGSRSSGHWAIAVQQAIESAAEHRVDFFQFRRLPHEHANQ